MCLKSKLLSGRKNVGSLIFMLVFCSVANTGPVVETRVAVMEQRLATICEDIQELKGTMVTKHEMLAVNNSLSEIKVLMNPRFAKVDQIDILFKEHLREHQRNEKRGDNRIYWAIAIFALLFSATQAAINLLRSRNGKHLVPKETTAGGEGHVG